MYFKKLLLIIFIQLLVFPKSAKPQLVSCASPDTCSSNAYCGLHETEPLEFNCLCLPGFVNVGGNTCAHLTDITGDYEVSCSRLENSAWNSAEEMCECAPGYYYDTDLTECYLVPRKVLDPCDSDTACQVKFALSHCYIEAGRTTGFCQCNSDQFISLDAGSCIPLATLVGNPCNVDDQCGGILNSVCRQSDENPLTHWGTCECSNGFEADDSNENCVAEDVSSTIIDTTTEDITTIDATTEEITTSYTTTEEITTMDTTTEDITTMDITTESSTSIETTTMETTTEDVTTDEITTAESIAMEESTTLNTAETSTMPSTTTGSTTTPSTTQQTTPGPTSSTVCQGADQYGNAWQGMGGQVVVFPCPGRDTGNAMWKCGLNGVFVGNYPDYTECSTKWISEVSDNIRASIADGSLNTAKGTEYLSLFEESLSQALESSQTDPTGVGENEYFGHEVNEIFESVKLVVTSLSDTGSEFNLTSSEQLTTKALDVAEKVMQFQKPWAQMSQTERTQTFANAISVLETSSLEHSNKVGNSQGSNYVNSLTNNQDLLVVSGLAEDSSEVSFPPNVKHQEGRNSFIKLPKTWKNHIRKINLNQAESSVTSFVGMQMDSKFVDGNIPPKAMGVEEEIPRDVNSKMMSFSFSEAGQNVNFGDEAVEVTMQLDQEGWSEAPLKIRRKLGKNEKPRAAAGTSQCVFFNATLKVWSTKGCKLVQSGPYSVTCECNHLSSFAVLSQFHQYVGKSLFMELATVALYGLPALTILNQLYSNPPGFDELHKSGQRIISVFILLGNLLLVLFIDKYYLNLGDNWCYFIGLASHFIFLTSFSFLLICTVDCVMHIKINIHPAEAPYRILIIISTYKKFIYSGVIVGIPFLIVLITAATGALTGPASRAYGGEFCWLDGSYIWAFYVPIIVMFLLNSILLGYWKYCTRALRSPEQGTSVENEQLLADSEQTMSQNTQFLLLLGLTWCIGFYEIGPKFAESNFLGFIFPFLNGLQGVMLLMANRASAGTTGGVFESVVNLFNGSPQNQNVNGTLQNNLNPLTNGLQSLVNTVPSLGLPMTEMPTNTEALFPVMQSAPVLPVSNMSRSALNNLVGERPFALGSVNSETFV